ncbi:MAG: hypothetical protein ABIK26_02480, partial [Candidatus Omnitrophota bacterium]
LIDVDEQEEVCILGLFYFFDWVLYIGKRIVSSAIFLVTIFLFFIRMVVDCIWFYIHFDSYPIKNLKTINNLQ